MQHWDLNKTGLRRMAIAGVLAGMVLILGCGGGAGEEDTTKVAASDTAASTPTALAQTVKALDSQPFAFSNGSAVSESGGCQPDCSSLATQPMTLTFTNTAAPTPTATVTAPTVTGTNGQQASFTGATTFGSCTFVVTASTFRAGTGPQVGNTITVNPCQVNIKTGGVQANGQATVVQILLHLGLVPSRANQAQVAIDPDTGMVTVNNVSTGLTVTLKALTGTGTTGTAGTP
jgi:hypothetical protein